MNKHTDVQSEKKKINKILLDAQPHNQHNTGGGQQLIFREIFFRSLQYSCGFGPKEARSSASRPCSCLSAHHSSVHIKVKHACFCGFSLFQHGYCLTQLRSVYIMAASRGGGMGRECIFDILEGRVGLLLCGLHVCIGKGRNYQRPNQQSISCLCAVKEVKPVYTLLRVNMIHAEVRTG